MKLQQEDLLVDTSNEKTMIPCTGRQLQDRRIGLGKPNPICETEIQRCPRCDSSNTKFCYYNNYSLAQPRHFCKACKRYWTKGGALRNVPVGGGCRKNKRSKQQSGGRPPPPPAPPENSTCTTLLPTPLSDRHSNGARSSERDQFSAASSHGLFTAASDGVKAHPTGLAFERLDQTGAEQSFPRQSLPLPITWASSAGQTPSETALHPPFDQSTILGLNLAAHHVMKQGSTGLQNADLSSMLESHDLDFMGRTQSLLAAHDTLGLPGYNLGMDAHGMAPSQWRFPAPRLVTMVERSQGYCPSSTSAPLLQEEASLVERIKIMRSKPEFEEINMQISGNLMGSCAQEAETLACEWPSNAEGFFGDSHGDAGNSPYWSNGSWPHEDEIYEDGPHLG